MPTTSSLSDYYHAIYNTEPIPYPRGGPLEPGDTFRYSLLNHVVFTVDNIVGNQVYFTWDGHHHNVPLRDTTLIKKGYVPPEGDDWI